MHEIRLARPPVNALNPDLLQALRAGIEAAPGNGARGIVLSGGPGVFSGGMDVPHLMDLDAADLRKAWDDFFAACIALAKCPVPVVAAIGGHAPAGGCVLALCCDYRVMARSPDPSRPFRIGLNEVQVGLAVPEGIQILLRRLVGLRRAERLLVSGAMAPRTPRLRDRHGRRAGRNAQRPGARDRLARGTALAALGADAAPPANSPAPTSWMRSPRA